MAKKFRFKLAPVLKYRETIQEECRTRFLQVQEMRNQQMRELDKLREESSRAVESMTDAKTGTLDMSRVLVLNRYITGLNISQQQGTVQLRAIEREAEKRRDELVIARKDVRVMEKLEERRFEEHLYEEGREETKVFDEIAGQAHRRRELEDERHGEERVAGAEALRVAQIAQAAYGGNQPTASRPAFQAEG